MPEQPRASKKNRHHVVLEQRARELARPLKEHGNPSGSLNIVTFTLGKEKFGIELAHLKEVQPLAALHWSVVPCTPQFVVGVVNIRGRL